MSENIAQTVQKAIQDLVAPDVRELKALVLALQQQIDQRFEAQEQVAEAWKQQIDQRFDAQDAMATARNQKADAQFQALMAAFGEFKAQNELAIVRGNSQLSERIAVLEARRSA